MFLGTPSADAMNKLGSPTIRHTTNINGDLVKIDANTRLTVTGMPSTAKDPSEYYYRKEPVSTGGSIDRHYLHLSPKAQLRRSLHNTTKKTDEYKRIRTNMTVFKRLVQAGHVNLMTCGLVKSANRICWSKYNNTRTLSILLKQNSYQLDAVSVITGLNTRLLRETICKYLPELKDLASTPYSMIDRDKILEILSSHTAIRYAVNEVRALFTDLSYTTCKAQIFKYFPTEWKRLSSVTQHNRTPKYNDWLCMDTYNRSRNTPIADLPESKIYTPSQVHYIIRCGRALMNPSICVV